jgi:hypothetical protein
MIDILLNFVIVKTELDTNNWRKIAKEYATHTFILDLVAILPTVVWNQPPNLQVTRLLRLFWRKDIMWYPILWLTNHFVSNSYRRNGYCFIAKLIISIIVMCHFYVCFWIYLGDKYFLNDPHDPWLIANESDFGHYSSQQIYIFAFYWICETISTVGYGNYSGGTSAEYLFSMIVEFSGLSLVSILMFSLSKIIAEEFNFEKFVEKNVFDANIWITKVEKCNKPKFLKSQLFLKILKNIETAFQYDINLIIEEFDFYQKLTPKDQNEVIDLLFGHIKSQFKTYFEGCEQGFVNDMIS